MSKVGNNIHLPKNHTQSALTGPKNHTQLKQHTDYIT